MGQCPQLEIENTSHMLVGSRRSEAVTTYKICALISTWDEHYYATAANEMEARKLVARLVPRAAKAWDAREFYCVTDSTHDVPPGTVLSADGTIFSETAGADWP